MKEEASHEGPKQVTSRGPFSVWQSTDDDGGRCAYVVKTQIGGKQIPLERFRGETAIADAMRKFRKIAKIQKVLIVMESGE